MLRLLLLFLPLFACACAGCSSTLGLGRSGGEDGFTFTYEMDLGRDCFMMNTCGYRLVLGPDGTLRRFDDQGREEASVSLSAEERAALREQLEAAGFFELPARLPDVPEEEVPRGGRVVTMTYERADGSRSHRIEAHTDAVEHPLPEGFLTLNEEVRTYLLARLGDE